MDRERDRIAGPAVDPQQLPALANPQFGVVGVVLQAGDDHIFQHATQFVDDLAEQVVGQGARRLFPLDVPIDAGGLEDSNHDRERPLASGLAEPDNLLIIQVTDDDPRQLHRHQHGSHSPVVRAPQQRPQLDYTGRNSRRTSGLISPPQAVPRLTWLALRRAAQGPGCAARNHAG
jgi:hypothetical protein